VLHGKGGCRAIIRTDETGTPLHQPPRQPSPFPGAMCEGMYAFGDDDPGARDFYFSGLGFL
jgi:hypothetical protein